MAQLLQLEKKGNSIKEEKYYLPNSKALSQSSYMQGLAQNTEDASYMAQYQISTC